MSEIHYEAAPTSSCGRVATANPARRPTCRSNFTGRVLKIIVIDQFCILLDIPHPGEPSVNLAVWLVRRD